MNLMCNLKGDGLKKPFSKGALSVTHVHIIKFTIVLHYD